MHKIQSIPNFLVEFINLSWSLFLLLNPRFSYSTKAFNTPFFASLESVELKINAMQFAKYIIGLYCIHVK